MTAIRRMKSVSIRSRVNGVVNQRSLYAELHSFRSGEKYSFFRVLYRATRNTLA